MPQFKTGTTLGLSKITVDVDDTSFLSADYFILSDFNNTFGLGKNSFVINKYTTDIKIEAYDAGGMVLYYEKASDVDFIRKTQSIIISYHLYQQNTSGIGKLIIVGTVDGKTVRYTTNLIIDTSVVNKSKVRFYNPPKIEITPLLTFATKTATSEINPKQATGSFKGKAIYPVSSFNVDENKYNRSIVDYKLTTDQSVSSSFSGFYANLYVTKIRNETATNDVIIANTASLLIKNVLNSNTLQIDTPFIYRNSKNKNVVTDIIEGSYDIIYSDYTYNSSLFNTSSYLTQSSLVNGSLFKKYSIAEVTYRNLDTFSGTVARHKVYRKSLNYPSDYSLIADEAFVDTEILKNHIVPIKNYQNIGEFYAQDFINSFWFTSSTQMSLYHDSSTYMNSMKISGSSINSGYIIVKLNTDSSNRDASYIPYNTTEYSNQSGPAYDSNFIKLYKDNSYVLSFNCNLEDKNITDQATLDFYLTGSYPNNPKELSYDIVYGVKLADLLISDEVKNKNYNAKVQFKFTPTNDLYGTLVIVPRKFNKLSISNLSIKLDKTPGFSATSYTTRIPFNVDQINELYDIKSELYDAYSNLVYSNLRDVKNFDPSGSSSPAQSGNGDLVVNSINILGNLNLSGLEQVTSGRTLVLSGSGTGTKVAYL